MAASCWLTVFCFDSSSFLMNYFLGPSCMDLYPLNNSIQTQQTLNLLFLIWFQFCCWQLLQTWTWPSKHFLSNTTKSQQPLATQDNQNHETAIAESCSFRVFVLIPALSLTSYFLSLSDMELTLNKIAFHSAPFNTSQLIHKTAVATLYWFSKFCFDSRSVVDDYYLDPSDMDLNMATTSFKHRAPYHTRKSDLVNCYCSAILILKIMF